MALVPDSRSWFRLADMAAKDSFHIRPEAGPTLERLGFLRFEDFFLPPSSEVVSEVRDRIVYRVAGETGPGGSGYFLKVFKNPGANRPWSQLAALERPRSCAEIEVERLQWLEDHHFLAPRWVAWGAEMSGFSEIRSFLMTETLVGKQGLDEWLNAARAALAPREFRIRKRRRLTGAARLLANLHEAGFHHPYPYLRHFFVPEFGSADGPEPQEPPIAVIDVHSAEIGGAVSRRKRARGLAELLVSSLKGPLTSTDRVYFLREYGGGELDREMAAAAVKRFQQKVKRHPNRYAWAREFWEGMKFPRSARED